jgi:hypothetical protein
MNGNLHDLKVAFGQYMGRFHAGIYPDTAALREYVTREQPRAQVFPPGRMVDSVEDMLKAYQKNQNSTPGHPYTPGANALFPIIFVAMAKDYIPTGGDFGGRQVGRRLVALLDGEGQSVYGYRQAMGDVRVQIAIFASEPMTTGSLAAQLALFVGEIKNRRFRVKHLWGQYELDMPCMLESPDIIFSKVDMENQNMSCVLADLTLKITMPFLDAPADGEDNDGSTNDPPGYPLVEQINCLNEVAGDVRVVRVEVP